MLLITSLASFPTTAFAKAGLEPLNLTPTGNTEYVFVLPIEACHYDTVFRPVG